MLESQIEGHSIVHPSLAVKVSKFYGVNYYEEVHIKIVAFDARYFSGCMVARICNGC